jgi:hypothetical protein
MAIEKGIEDFIAQMRFHYPLLDTIVEYDATDDDYLISHNHKNWQDCKFRELKISLMKSIFESSESYRVCFAFSSALKKSETAYCSLNNFRFPDSMISDSLIKDTYFLAMAA